MKMIVKFNLVFIVVFLIGLAAAATVSHQLLQRNAREEIVQNARLLMESALATRAYTSTQVGPLLQTQMKYSFLPQSVPAYSATEVFNGVRKSFPQYDYKEATINPTNPVNRANDWEADIVKQFRATASTEMVGERDTPTGRSFYIARPIEIKAQSCLSCHSTVAAAPRTLVDRYGPANGFGWKMNEVIGAQIVSVPTEVPVARANAAFRTFMGSLTLVFALVFVALNVMLWYTVVRPVTRLSRLADQLSQGECLEAPDLEVKSGDEIGVLTQSFNRMKKSLVETMQMLETSGRPA
jgi:HAMP domain-containing protein